MTGGVAQWVADCWVKDHQGAPRNGAARELPNCRRYVLRGGSWKNDPELPAQREPRSLRRGRPLSGPWFPCRTTEGQLT